MLKSLQKVHVGLECAITKVFEGGGRWAMHNCAMYMVSSHLGHCGFFYSKRYAIENVWGRVFLSFWRYYLGVLYMYIILLDVQQCAKYAGV